MIRQKYFLEIAKFSNAFITAFDEKVSEMHGFYFIVFCRKSLALTDRIQPILKKRFA